MGILVVFQAPECLWIATAGELRRSHSVDTNVLLFQFGLACEVSWKTDAVERRFLDSMWRAPGDKFAAVEASVLEIWRREFPRLSRGLSRGVRHGGIFAEMVMVGRHSDEFRLMRLGMESRWNGSTAEISLLRHRPENPLVMADSGILGAVLKSARRLLPEAVDEVVLNEILARHCLPLPYRISRIDEASELTEWEFKEKVIQPAMRRKPKTNGYGLPGW